MKELAVGRILKKSICQSDDIDQLAWFEEVLFYRLIVNCDDYGIFDGRAKILRGTLFPLKDDITIKQIEDAVTRLATVGLVRQYEVQGRPYLQLSTWSKHQRLRESKHTYPMPEDTISHDNPPRVAANCGKLPLEVESESESKSECEMESEGCTELHSSTVHDNTTVPQAVPAVVPALILNDGAEWFADAEDVSTWEKLYPAVDITRELGRMREWCRNNPKRRKTSKGIRRFVTSWLDNEQNRPRRAQAGPKTGKTEPRGADAYFAMAQEMQTL